MRRPKGIVIGFWIATALFCLQIGFTAFAQLRLPQVAQAFAHLGFPPYFRVELSWAKLLGVVLMLAPVPARLKEWAYAGVVFDLSGATVSHLVSGSPAFHPVITTTLLVVAGLSWATRPASRRLTAPVAPQRESVPA